MQAPEPIRFEYPKVRIYLYMYIYIYYLFYIWDSTYNVTYPQAGQRSRPANTHASCWRCRRTCSSSSEFCRQASFKGVRNITYRLIHLIVVVVVVQWREGVMSKTPTLWTNHTTNKTKQGWTSVISMRQVFKALKGVESLYRIGLINARGSASSSTAVQLLSWCQPYQSALRKGKGL